MGGILNSFLGGDGISSALQSVVQAVVNAVKAMIDYAMKEMRDSMQQDSLDEMLARSVFACGGLQRREVAFGVGYLNS